MDQHDKFYHVVKWTKILIFTVVWSMIAAGAMTMGTGFGKWNGLQWYMFAFTGPAAGFTMAFGFYKK